MNEINFAKVVGKMVKSLTKSNRNLMAGKHQTHPEIKKIYFRKAQDRYDEYTMWHNVLPTVIREEMGDTFNMQDKVYVVLQEIFTNWAKGIKEDLDKSKMM